ncbi:MAG: AMP-binding protein [Acidobacteriota bacterium]
MAAFDALALYHRLPYPLKVAAASAHGLRLRRWRYGDETDRLVAEALERDYWDADEWRRFHDEQLRRRLDDAALHVPAYAARRPGTPLDAWPLLHKSALRSDPRAFLDTRRNPKKLYAEHTSGTSGTPLRLFWSRRTVRAWYALSEARSRAWYGVAGRDRWASLGGQLVADTRRTEPPFWVWNAGLRQLYLSSYHLSASLVGPYLKALEAHRVRYLWGYPSALATLAALTLDATDGGGARHLGLKVAIANAEPVLGTQRRLVEEAFGCPLRETYGMAELAAAASECEHGRLHLWPDVSHVEIQDDDGRAAPAGEAGRLVATGLVSDAQPLVRYVAGDRLRLAVDDACPCGRTLPVLAAVEGRVDDVIVTPDGRRIGRLDPVFKADLPMLEAQIVQESPTAVRLRYVPEKRLDGAGRRRLEADLRRRLASRLPGMGVEVEAVDTIPRGAQGKFQAVVGLDQPAL